MPRLAVITGASQGLGARVAEGLIKDTNLLNISRSPCRIESMNGFHLHNLGTDFADDVATVQALEEWFDGHPAYQVNLLILNAATLGLGPLCEKRPADFLRVFKTNVVAAATIVRTLLTRGRFDRSGTRIVVVTSSLARQDPSLSFAGVGLYSLTKAALSRWGQIQKREFALTEPHIRMARLHPGIVDTDMQGDLRSDPRIDDLFVRKTAALPPYQAGDWDTVAPHKKMRTISADMSAQFVLWAARSASLLDDEYDYYTCEEFHEANRLEA